MLKTSSNEAQRIRVYKEIKELEKKLDGSIITGLDKELSISNTIDSYEYLKGIAIVKVASIVDNNEVNEIYTFLKYLEDELLVVLSPYHLKLEIHYSMVRKAFYTDIHICYSALYLYVETLEKLDNLDNNEILESYKTKFKLNSQSEYRNLLSKLSTFLSKLYNFTSELIESYNGSGQLVLNPDDILKLSESVDEKGFMDNYIIIDGIKYLHHFLSDVIEYLRLPRMI